MEVDLAALNNLASRGTFEFGNIEFDDIYTPFELEPSNYLEFARFDFGNRCNHHLINSLTNSKRALDCQLDSLLYGFGLYPLSKRKHWNFPTKVNCMRDLSIASPHILERINSKRNRVEHDYIKPKKDRTKDALDTAELFIRYTDKYLYNAVVAADFTIRRKGRKNYCLGVHLDYPKERILLFEGKLPTKRRFSSYDRIIQSDDPEYFGILSWFLLRRDDAL